MPTSALCTCDSAAAMSTDISSFPITITSSSYVPNPKAGTSSATFGTAFPTSAWPSSRSLDQVNTALAVRLLLAQISQITHSLPCGPLMEANQCQNLANAFERLKGTSFQASTTAKKSWIGSSTKALAESSRRLSFASEAEARRTLRLLNQ